jgi:hypothetical protein
MLRSLAAVYLLALIPAHGGEADWKPLLDDKLSQWEVWIGSPHVTVKDLPPGTPQSEEGHEGAPLGAKDPKGVFTARIEDGEPVLAITGEIFGGLNTKESFSNYHFRAQVKWGDRKWEPRAKDSRDNGILYHCTGKQGAMWNSWKRSVEYQVQEGDFGDLFLLVGTRGDVATSKKDDRWHYDPAGELHAFGAGEGALQGSPLGNGGDFEMPHGEWNTVEIYTLGQDAIHVVNGHVVLVVRNICNQEDKAIPLTAGQIQIQSEGAECYYRRVEIRPITEFPAGLKLAAKL